MQVDNISKSIPTINNNNIQKDHRHQKTKTIISYTVETYAQHEVLTIIIYKKDHRYQKTKIII